MKIALWLAKLAASAVLVSVLTVFTTWYVVNGYIENILQRFNINLQGQSFQTMDFLSGMLGGSSKGSGDKTAGGGGGAKSGNGSGTAGAGDAKSTSGGAGSTGGGTKNSQDDAGANGGEVATGKPDEKGTGAGGTGSADSAGSGGESGGTAQEDAQGDDSGDGRRPQGDDDAVPVFNQQSGSGGLIMTPEEITKTKSKVSESDKLELFNLLTTKLKPEDLQTISGYVEDGITELELNEIKQVLAKSLKDDEYKKVLDILSKY